jgi:hypothetical protein
MVGYTLSNKMKCFNHPQFDGIAVCKSCGRVLCHECYAEVGTGSACKARCESDVEDLNIIIKRSKSAYQKTGGAYRMNGIVMLILGLVFLFIGIIPVITGRGYATVLLAIMGLLFVIWSYFSFVSAKRISSIEE